MGNWLHLAEKNIVGGHRMRRGLFYSGVCAFVSLLLLVGGRWLWRVPAAEPSLYVSPNGLRVGPVLAQTGYIHSFVIANTSTRPIGIDRFLTSCGCADVTPESIRLEPGESAAIRLKLDLLRYLRLSEDAVVSGAVNLTPVIDGISDRGWILNLEVIRPNVYMLCSEVDFGLVSTTANEVESAETVHVSDAAKDVRVTTDFPLVSELRLNPIGNATGGYSGSRLSASLSKQRRPFGEFTFSASMSAGADHEPVIMPCRIRFDSGLRADIDEVPPRIVQIGQPVCWSIRVHRSAGPLRNAALRIGQQNGQCELEITREPSDDSTWRFRCECVPETAGNLLVLLEASGEFEGGVVATQPVEMRFYALTESLDPKGS
jgi:hypothetical protein